MPTINGFAFPSFVTGYQSNNFGGLQAFPQNVKLGVFSVASGSTTGTNVAATPGSLLIAIAVSHSAGGSPSISDNNANVWTPLRVYGINGSGILAWVATANSSTNPLNVTFVSGSNGSNSLFGLIQLPSSYVGAFASADNQGNSGVASVTVGGYTLSLNLHFNGAWDLFMMQWGGGVVGSSFRLAFLGLGTFNIATHSLPTGWIEADSTSTPNYGLFPGTNFGEVSFAFSDVGLCQLAGSPPALNFAANVNGLNPTPQTLSISNSGGGGSVPFTFSTPLSWLSPSNGSGSTPGAVTVSVNIVGLVAGVYTGSITFNSTCGSPPLVIPVTLTLSNLSRCAPVDGSGALTSGVFVPDLSLFVGPATALYTNPVLPSVIALSELSNEGRKSIVLDFNNGDGLYARDLGTVLQWPTNSGTQVLVWQPSIIPMPEAIYDRATDWDDAGSPGAKFIQGVIIEAFSFGNTKTFFLQDSDTLNLHSLNECPVTFARQQEVAFSCAPFIAHSVRLISSDGVEWRIWKSRLVSQPWPEMTMNWQTELTSLGMTGWAHAREMNLAYLSTAPVTLTLTFDSITPVVIALPSTSGVQNKTKITLPPNKWKLIGFQASSASPFRVFRDDIEVKLREWGAQGPYGVVKPFGGKSDAGALV